MSVRPLPPELEEIARRELHETPEILKDGIQHIKDWIHQQPHLRARTDDQWLASFLRGCKHDKERTKKKIEAFYSFRTKYPELYVFNDPKYKELMKSGCFYVLPKLLNPLGPKVTVTTLAACDTSKFGPEDLYSLSYMLVQTMLLEDDSFVVNGAIGIVDFKGATLSHLLQLTPRHIKKLINAVQDCMPLRIKGIYYINCMPIFEKLFNMVKMLFNEKLRKRVFVLSCDIDGLDINIPKEILPEELGGTDGTTKDIVDHWMQKLEDYGTWFEDDMKFGVDEAIRPGKPKKKPVQQLEID